ncbi:MAG: phosphoglycerate mutase (2,3-diphosphoglycerate-independent) [Candidatus Woykebacteria bacterium RIFCSPHIGHO2_12_FULL_43_10]|nr:MAG: phosphoglycerate mutase (2,3-diphosphoglycerate-independent) [Candidatus Woykebacteria bacterium RIFCSPHIGHO2_12_FULL_43_10]
MDRDRRWERISKAYLAINGASVSLFTKAEEAVLDSYKKGIFDEFIEPSSITDKEGATVGIDKEDQLLFFNFRADRVRQIVSALVDPDFKRFERINSYQDLSVVTMTDYEQGLPVQVAFEREITENTLSQVISEQGLTQLHLAETEKYAHVTYFFNGGREESFAGEKRILVPSPKVETYDQKPEMSAREITETLLTNLKEKDYDFVVVNFANPDMVGHSAKIPETIKALEVVDECLGKIEKEVNALSGALVITADHGKAEQLLDPDTGKPDTAHSTNPVPVIIVQKSLAGYSNNKLNKGLLSDVAPTVLKLMGLGQPKEMMGKSLI